MFAEMMIPHHAQAIEMSDVAISKSTNQEILKLAKEIKAAQEPEIAQMKAWGGVNADNHMGHSMMGMLSQKDLDKLKVASAKEFDRLFLEGMIFHHEGAIDMARMVEDSQNSEVAKLAKEIIQSQEAEIALMRELLSNLD